MKYIIILLICLVGVQGLDAQSLSLFDVDATNFPTMKAKFYAFDVGGKQQRPDESELSLTENGTPRTITDATCPGDPTKSLSICIMVDTYQHIELAQSGTKQLISYLIPGKDEIGITIMKEGVQIHRDFTDDLIKASAAAISIPGAPGVDIQKMFYYPYAGGVPFITSRKADKKILILVSDLHCPNLNVDTTQLYKDAATQNIAIYSVLLGTNDYSGLFSRIASHTGGRVFENVRTNTIIANVFQEIERNEHYPPCEVTWQSESGCLSRVTASLNYGIATSYSTYSKPNNAIASLKITPSFIAYGRKEISQANDSTLTLTAINSDITISGITSKINSQIFTIIDLNFPFTIPKGTSKTITVRFLPLDSAIYYEYFEISTNLCEAYFSASGGFSGKKLKLATLKVVKPNGGESFYAGSDSLITWSGISESDTVQIDYTIDNGTTWKEITDKASGLEYLWKNIPLPESNRCKVRIKQPNGKSKAGTPLFYLAGHIKDIIAAKWSPDRTKVTVVSNDGRAIVWDVTTNLPISTLWDYTPTYTNMMVWSPDGTKMAGHNVDNIACIWDANTGIILQKLVGHSKKITDIDWSPDGEKVATASWDNTVITWDVKTGDKINTLTGHTSEVKFVQWKKKKKSILGSAYYNTIIIWDAITGTIQASLSGHKGEISDANWSPNSAKVATSCFGDSTAIIWDAATGLKLFTLVGNNNPVNSAAWNPDGSKLVTANGRIFGKNHSAIIWDANTGTILSSLVGHRGEVFVSEWSPDGTKIATGSRDSTVIIWDASKGTILTTLNNSILNLKLIVWNPDGTTILCGGLNSEPKIWDVQTGKKISDLTGHTEFVKKVSWSPLDFRVATVSKDTNLIIWDGETGLKINTLRGHTKEVNSVSWSPDASRIATAGSDSTSIIWDAHTGTKLLELKHPKGIVKSVSWSYDASLIATTQESSMIIWNAVSGEKLHTLNEGSDWKADAVWSPNDLKVITTSYGGYADAIVWDAVQGSIVYKLKTYCTIYNDNVSSVAAWSPDGSKIATGWWDGAFVIWDASTGKELQKSISVFNATIYSVNWKPDGTKIAFSGFIYDVALNSISDTLEGGYGGIGGIQWSPDESKILASFQNYTAGIWDSKSGKKLYVLGDSTKYGNGDHFFAWNPQSTKVATVGVGFTPKIWLIVDSNSILQQDSSDAFFSIVAPKPKLNTILINLGKVLVGSEHDSTVNAVLCNEGLAPLHVLGIDITGGNISDFIIPRGAGDFTLLPNECRDIMFEFIPSKVGNRSAKATIRTTIGNFKDTVTIVGQGIAPSLAIVNEFIDFGKSPVGIPKDTLQVVTIKNVGTSDQIITGTSFETSGHAEYSAIAATNTFTIKPNGIVKMDLRFNPSDVGRTSGLLHFYYNGIGSPATI